MLMLAPSGGGLFTGNSGFSYTAKDGERLEIGGADVAMAIRLGWAPYDISNPPIPPPVKKPVDVKVLDKPIPILVVKPNLQVI